MVHSLNSDRCLRLFKTKWFRRYAHRAGLGDAMLVEAIRRAERGLIDVDLGGGIIKQRVARKNEGRSGGFRTLVGYRAGDRAVFLYGFAKNERDSIRPDELENLRRTGRTILATDEAGLLRAFEAGEIDEVKYDETK